MKYNVHVYLVVRVLVPDVEADSQAEACEKAEEAWDWVHLLRSYGDDFGPEVEYADEITGFLVDEDGDTEHQRSASYDANYVREELPADAKE